MNCSTPGFRGLHYFPDLLKLMSTESAMLSNDLILCRSLLFHSVFPSIRVFSKDLTLRIRWPKYQSFSFSIYSSNQYSGLISFNIDWFGLLAVQGALKRFLQHHSPKASILLYTVFFTVQLSHPYVTTGQTIALTIWTFDGKVMSLLFNTLSRFLIASLPRNKCLLILWLQSPSVLILETKKMKYDTFSTFSPFLPWSDRTGCHDLKFWLLTFKPDFSFFFGGGSQKTLLLLFFIYFY